jgi:ribose 5-phosphate isomerase B
MSPQTIAIAADHGGFELKSALKRRLAEEGFDVLDLGTDDAESVDYPDFAAKVAKAISDGRSSRGVLLCGSGIGMSIAANRYPGIRAALVHDAETARLSRQHNDANVLVMGGRLIETDVAEDCLNVFLTTSFEGGRHERRVGKLA